MLRSRRGTRMGPAFPEIVAGAAQLPEATAFDGELVVLENGRLAFEKLQNRLQQRGAGVALAAVETRAHLLAFGPAEALRHRYDDLALPTPPGRVGVRLRRKAAVGAMGIVPIDYGCGHGP